MKTISGKISDNYDLELTVFDKLREISDGVVFFDGKMTWDRYLADHSPRFEIHVVLFNHTIIEVNVYYLHHRDEEEQTKIMNLGKNDISIKVKISGLQLEELQKHTWHMIEAFGLDTKVENYKGVRPI